ncbi:hypothetical protein KR215_007907 [Drosophila sulfurigaster]|nr:hypothetical protein KR215_007907 [Drosophila sulfurigaster]
MKFIALGILYLLSAVAWALEPFEYVDEEFDIFAANNDSDPLSISTPFLYLSDPYVLSITKKLNWFEATAACAARGFTLVSIESLTKQQALYKTIAGSGIQNQMYEPIWTSGSNLANGAVWSWYSTGYPLTYRNFRNQYVESDYRCLAYNAINGRWTPELCSSKRYFICECA